MRSFIRHPAEIPIEIHGDVPTVDVPCHSHDVSLGGLAFAAKQALLPGDIVEVCISCVSPVFESRARVAWCHDCGQEYELGVEFLDPDDAFRLRMVEQVCYIEQYKNAVEKEDGRQLSAEEAAAEWIAKFAGEFPGEDV